MIFQRIEHALNLSKKHLQDMDEADFSTKEVEIYLVSGLVVLIVSEYEEYLESLFKRRADYCGDNYVKNYLKITLSQKFRSPDLSKINETLKRFDTSCKDSFFQEIENSSEHAAWDSLLKARHAVVHKKGTLKLTFNELEGIYIKTKRVISNVESAINMSSLPDDYFQPA